MRLPIDFNRENNFMSTTKTAENALKGKKSNFIREIMKYKILWIMALPSIIYFLLFSYVPMFGAVLAFKKYDYALGILKSPWCGMENFKFFFNSGQALLVTRNTFLYNLVFIFLGNIMQMITACLDISVIILLALILKAQCARFTIGILACIMERLRKRQLLITL